MKKLVYYLLIPIIVFFVNISIINAQEKTKIIPTSPEAAALTKMVNYPVNRNTGIPDISIPIYEINSGGLTFPVTLQYHGGGFKINEQAGRYGLGWSLSVDLQITRTVNGLDDFLGNGIGYMNNSLVLSTGYKFTDGTPFPNANMYDLAAGRKDGQPDKFDYQLLNKSGSFFILKTGTTYQFMPIPYDNIKIEILTGGTFIITDTDGTIYYFEKQESTYTPDKCTTAWKCSKILNNLGKEVLTFSYIQKPSRTVRSKTDCIEYYKGGISPVSTSSFGSFLYSNKPPLDNSTYYMNSGTTPFYKLSTPKYVQFFADENRFPIVHLPYYDTNTNTLKDKQYNTTSSSGLGARNPFNNIVSIERIMLNEIVFRGGRIKFINDDYQLRNIQIYYSSDTIRSIRLYQNFTAPYNMTSYQYYNGVENRGTPYLDSLIINAKGQKFEKYSFLYNSKICYGNHLFGHDAWGYPNINTQEISPYLYSVPGNIAWEKHILSATDTREHLEYRTESQDYWVQASDEYVIRSGVLKRIIYPTGGYVDFDFEPNKYLASLPYYIENGIKREDLIQYCGGLRIRSINYYDKGARKPNLQKYYKYGLYEEGTGELNTKPEINKFVGTYGIDEINMDKYSLGAVTRPENIVHIIQNPTNPNLPSDPNRSQYMTVLIDNKISIFPASILDYTYENGSPILYNKVTEYNSDLGVLTGKKVYEYYLPKDFDQRWHNLPRISETLMSYIKTTGYVGALKKVSEYKLNGNQFVLLRKKTFEYEKYLYPSEIQVGCAAFTVLYSIISNGVSSISTDALYYDNRYQYQFPTYLGEYTLGGYSIPIVKLLLKKETEENFDAVPALTKITEYYYNRLQPRIITTTNSNGYSVVKTLKYAYDFDGIYDTMESKNMISQVVEERHSMANEFFYKKTNYATNTDVGGIVPISLEKSYDTKPVFIETTFDKYDQYGNILQITNKDKIPTSYLWGYEGVYPVAQITGATYSQIPDTYKNNPTISSPSSDDALRTVLNGLRTAMNSLGLIETETYTYKKLTGITSKTTANASITYFDYDDYGRLVSIRDNDQKTVKKYEYRYTNPESYAFETMRSNIPVLFTESVLGTTPVSYNKILQGGVVDSGSDPEAISQQLLSQGRFDYTLPADNSTQRIKITIRGYYDTTETPLRYSKVEVELYKDDQIMYSKKVRFGAAQQASYDNDNLPDNKEYLFVPPGEYTFSVESYGGNQYKKKNALFCFLSVNKGVYSFINNLSKLNLEAGKEYVVILIPPASKYLIPSSPR